IVHNVAAESGVGFSLTRTGKITDNIASDNSQFGFYLEEVVPFLRNSAFGNAGPGVVTIDEAASYQSAPAPYAAFYGNNFFGNDRNRPALAFGGYGQPYDYNPGTSAQCGVLNMGAVGESLDVVAGHAPPAPPVPTVVLQAANNYWGSTSGAKPSGPGDAAGGVCDQNGAATIVKPFATAAESITGFASP
ncbi:MAG: hypothetical protein ACRD3E_04745, partial [Terriglobales bacterium]